MCPERTRLAFVAEGRNWKLTFSTQRSDIARKDIEPFVQAKIAKWAEVVKRAG
jgi:hypothetical protein